MFTLCGRNVADFPYDARNIAIAHVNQVAAQRHFNIDFIHASSRNEFPPAARRRAPALVCRGF